MINKYVVIDLETTGNTPKRGDKIIQFAAVIIENGKITETFSSLVNPQQKIPAFIEELTGLNDEMVRDAPLFSEIATKVASLLEDSYFVAHNVLFDLSFLQEELIQSRIDGFYGPVLDTVELARILFPTADSYKLSDLAIQEDLKHDRPHQADSDAYVTAELLLILLQKLEGLPQTTIKQLSKLSGGLKSDIGLFLEDLLSRMEQKIETVPKSLEVYRGLALKRNHHEGDYDGQTVTTYPESQPEKEQLLKQAFPSYEKRDGQFIMMDMVMEAFKTSQHALIEAGTGVGKSLAYLLPGAIFAKKEKKPVLISTFTNQLQQQLMNKDIPLLKKMLSSSIKTSLLKGRSHYLSLAKFEQSLLEEEDNYDTTLTKMQILIWLTETKTGDSDELNLSSGGLIYWNKIKNEHSEFLQDKHWRQYDFYQRAKLEANEAELIITNHSVVLADIVSDKKILPEYEYAVIDEGHHFEKAAGKFFGTTIDYLTCRLLFGQIGLYDQKQLFYKFENLLKVLLAQHQEMHSSRGNKLLLDLFYVMDEFFKIVVIFSQSKQKRKPQTYNRISIRLNQDEMGKEWNALLTEAERFSFLLKDTIDYFTARLEQIKMSEQTISSIQQGILEEVVAVCSQLDELRKIIKSVFLQPSENNVRWIELDLRSIQNTTTIYAFPVNVSTYLHDHFFSQKKSIVVTSATLTVKQSFQYTISELGMESTKCIQKVIPSPFDYEKQVQLIIPEDLPEINSVSQQDYVIAISEHIISIAEATKGRMLILFTAHDMLKKTYDLIRESGFLDDFAIMAQGITSGSRTRLTRNFQRFDKAILLGTSSFWEGIDIPGEDLSCLIIVRLPFSSPDEPVTEAKSEIIKKQGGNPFSAYSLPEAIIRFKQGFGRLIRTESDRGIVVVFDRRIVTTRYGKAFLQSIPQVMIKKYTLDDMVRAIREWL
ncbi:ATP-dependent DNA helicase DinG [Bacillus sp. T3]|uniref:ATP-dependent DNA helicase DinG n=1 Tax=Bacillus sp. T3 TaxID=467262 RepID=UPI0029816ECE|nr:ATP-dependent DNA helicase DinG [Bacillus sp. T3]